MSNRSLNHRRYRRARFASRPTVQALESRQLMASFNFEGPGGTSALEGWTTTGLWHVSEARGTDTGHSSTHSLYYGQGESPTGGGNYKTGTVANSGTATSPLIDLSGLASSRLVFNYRTKMADSRAGYDRAEIQIGRDGNWTTVASRADGQLPGQSRFVSRTIDLTPFVGGPIQVRLAFDSVDAISNTGEGWYVDDLTIDGTLLDLPIAPVGVVAAVESSTAIRLAWQGVANATGYRVERSALGYDWVEVAALGSDARSYDDNGLSDGDSYFYRVRATNPNGISSPSFATYATIPLARPWVAVEATANPTPGTIVGSGNYDLAALGGVEGDEGKLTYTWSVLSKPDGFGRDGLTLTFLSQFNGTNASKQRMALLPLAGHYEFRVTIANGTASVTSDVAVDVVQKLSRIAVSSNSLYVLPGGTVQFSAIALDQFDFPMEAQPAFTWSWVNSSKGYPGVVNETGLFTASEFPTYYYGSVKATIVNDTVVPPRYGQSSVVITDTTGATYKDEIWDFYDTDYDKHLQDGSRGSFYEGTDYASVTSTGFSVHSEDGFRIRGNPGYFFIDQIPNGFQQQERNANIYIDITYPVRNLGFWLIQPQRWNTTGHLATIKVFVGDEEVGSIEAIAAPVQRIYRYYVDLSGFEGVSRLEILNSPDSVPVLVQDLHFQSTLRIDAVAHRTGGRFGVEVPDNAEDNPNQFVVFVNNDYEEGSGSGLNDMADETAAVPTGDESSFVDDDLVKITLRQLPAHFMFGVISIGVSSNAARIFKADGSVLNSIDQGLNLNIDTGSRFLAELLYGDVDVWLEGLHADPDLVFTYSFSLGGIRMVDTIHMTIADWSFRGYGDGGGGLGDETMSFRGDGGRKIESVMPVWKEALLAAASPEGGGIHRDPEGSFFRSVFAGLSASAGAILRVASIDDPADYYDDELSFNYAGAISANFAALYSSSHIEFADPDSPVTPEERTTIKQALGLNLVAGLNALATLTTLADVQTRFLHGLDDLDQDHVNLLFEGHPAEIFNVGDRIRGTITMGSPGWVGVNITLYGSRTRLHSVDNGQTWTFDLPATNAGLPRFSIEASRVGDFTGPNMEPQAHTIKASVLLNVLQAGAVMPKWHKAAWLALAGESGLVPGAPINRNRRITTLYAEIYNSTHPQRFDANFEFPSKFEWAGLAAFASKLAGDAMAEADFWRVAGPLPTWLGYPDTDELIDGFQEGNLAIFMDMYPQMLAFDSETGGINEIERMGKSGEIKFEEQIRAWILIDSGINLHNAGDIWKGTLLLAKIEQGETLQAILDPDPLLWASVPREKVKSPIPRDTSTFLSFVSIPDDNIPNTVSFGDGREFFDQDATGIEQGNVRYLWFARKMVPAWKKWRQDHGNIDPKVLVRGGYDQP